MAEVPQGIFHTFRKDLYSQLPWFLCALVTLH